MSKRSIIVLVIILALVSTVTAHVVSNRRLNTQDVQQVMDLARKLGYTDARRINFSDHVCAPTIAMGAQCAVSIVYVTTQSQAEFSASVAQSGFPLEGPYHADGYDVFAVTDTMTLNGAPPSSAPGPAAYRWLSNNGTVTNAYIEFYDIQHQRDEYAIDGHVIKENIVSIDVNGPRRWP